MKNDGNDNDYNNDINTVIEIDDNNIVNKDNYNNNKAMCTIIEILY